MTPAAHNPNPAGRKLSADELAAGVLEGNRTMLSRAITWIESEAPAGQKQARELSRLLLPHAGAAFRIGITGVPGAGKSTFIEAFGLHLCSRGLKIAVLAVDPSSTISRGSILGDKTRMEELARHPLAFIRPSPSSGAPGGVARKTRDSIPVLEAAGFDVILIETVGVGQSEVAVRSMVDFLLLLTITGAGDDLQGFKRGIIELADGILVTKADGENRERAEATRQELHTVLRHLRPPTPDWRPFVRTCSTVAGDGVMEVWPALQEFRAQTTAAGTWAARRQHQLRDAFDAQLTEAMRSHWITHPEAAAAKADMETRLLRGQIDVSSAVDTLIDTHAPFSRPVR